MLTETLKRYLLELMIAVAGGIIAGLILIPIQEAVTRSFFG